VSVVVLVNCSAACREPLRYMYGIRQRDFATLSVPAEQQEVPADLFESFPERETTVSAGRYNLASARSHSIVKVENKPGCCFAMVPRFEFADVRLDTNAILGCNAEDSIGLFAGMEGIIHAAKEMNELSLENLPIADAIIDGDCGGKCALEKFQRFLAKGVEFRGFVHPPVCAPPYGAERVRHDGSVGTNEPFRERGDFRISSACFAIGHPDSHANCVARFWLDNSGRVEEVDRDALVGERNVLELPDAFLDVEHIEDFEVGGTEVLIVRGCCVDYGTADNAEREAARARRLAAMEVLPEKVEVDVVGVIERHADMLCQGFQKTLCEWKAVGLPIQRDVLDGGVVMQRHVVQGGGLVSGGVLLFQKVSRSADVRGLIFTRRHQILWKHWVVS